jgi:ribulose-5-phosphate 4-epimerase/fuculose-1-phosphate aldolase
MLLEQERDDVVRTCRELAAAGLVVGTSGNVSVRAGDLIAVSPSGLDYADLTAELGGVHRLDGTAVAAPRHPDGPRLLPADEIALVAGQLASYGQRVPDGKPGR